MSSNSLARPFKSILIRCNFFIFHLGKGDVADVLIENDASLDNYTSSDVLIWAVKQSNLLHFINLLICSSNTKHVSLCWDKIDNENLTDKLIKNGANFRITNEDGQSMLHITSSTGKKLKANIQFK